MNSERNQDVARRLFDLLEQSRRPTLAPIPITWGESIKYHLPPWIMALVVGLVVVAAVYKRNPNGGPRLTTVSSEKVELEIESEETSAQECTTGSKDKYTDHHHKIKWVRKIRKMSRAVSAQAHQLTTGSPSSSPKNHNTHDLSPLSPPSTPKQRKTQIPSPLSIQMTGLPQTPSTQTLVEVAPSPAKSVANSLPSSLPSIRIDTPTSPYNPLPGSPDSLTEFPFPTQLEGQMNMGSSPLALPEVDMLGLAIPNPLMKRRTNSRFSVLKDRLSTLGRKRKDVSGHPIRS